MARFSKSHFTQIAAVLHDVRELSPTFDRTTTDAIAHRMADIFEEDNRGFDRQRFYNAVGIPMEESEYASTTTN